MDSRQQCFLNVSPELFSCHNNHQLCGQLNQTTSRVTLGQQKVFSLYNTLLFDALSVGSTRLWSCPQLQRNVRSKVQTCPFRRGRLLKEIHLSSVHTVTFMNIVFGVSVQERARKTHLLIPQFAKHVWVVTRITHKFSFEEGHVKAGRVVIDKLEQEHLHGQPVLILEVGFWDFCRNSLKMFSGYSQQQC